MLSPNTLHPLETSSVTFTYCLDRPLQAIATRYTPISRTAKDTPDKRIKYTLLLAGGISLNQETWLPFIKALYQFSANSSIHIQSVWTVERPNHGDASILNGAILKQHYREWFPSKQYSMAIQTFITSSALSTAEKQNLVALAHSGSGCVLVHTFLPPDGLKEIPYKALIQVESPTVDPSLAPVFESLYNAVKVSNQKRPHSFGTREAAVDWFKTHLPSSKFHPDVLNIISESYLHPDPENPGRLALKTTPEQETSSFPVSGADLTTWLYLRTVTDKLPTHLIFGGKKDLYPKPIYKMMDEYIRKDRKLLASLQYMDGVGHYIPVEKPTELAGLIMRVLEGSITSGAKL